MISIEPRLPKYYIIKRKIVEKIDSGEFNIENPIPSERELMEMFQVSRITIRKAIEELVNEDYLYKIQGKGTYIKQNEAESDLISIISCTEDVERHGMQPYKKLISFEKTKADLQRAKRLEITVEDNIYSMARVQYADDIPLNYTHTYLPEKYFPGLEKYSFESESLYNVIENNYGVKITKAKRTIEAILVKDKVAEYLEMEVGSPVLLFNCITYGMVNGKEEPIETFKCYYRTDTFKFYIDQHR